MVCGVAREIGMESYGPRHTSVILQYNIVVLILQAHTYIAVCCATMHDNKTHVAYDCTTHQTMAILSTMHCFIRTSLVSYSIKRYNSTS